jgi:glycosyltransferase involved in cell wall biosynthesis
VTGGSARPAAHDSAPAAHDSAQGLAGTDAPLRLAFLGDPGSIHTQRWLGFFVERGHDVHLLVPDKDRIPDDLDPRIRVHRFRAWPKLHVRGLGVAVTALTLRLALRAVRPDILHAHYLTRYGWAARLSGFRPYVITVWGSDVFVTPRTSAVAARWAPRVLANAACVTAVSADLARAAVELGAPQDRTVIVQFGVDSEQFAPGPAPAALRTSLGLAGRRVVLSPRGLRPMYRHEVAIEAAALLPDDVSLLLVAWQPDPEYLARLKALVAERGLGARVRFVESIPHGAMADYYRLADVVVSLPTTDAFPVTALECMACGVPIVMGDVPSAREGLGAVDPEAVVPGDDPVAVAAALRTRLDLSPAARADLAARLRHAAIERGDVSRNLLEMESMYRKLADRKRNRQ